MVTVDEETQAKEFLKRAEIRTMKKDLAVLREADALKERDKIAKIKTLEEQIAEKNKANLVVPVRTAIDEKFRREEVLQKNEGQEKIAEKDLKQYATEEERQQIFLMESQRLGFEKQIDAIDKEKDPALKLEKNQILIQKRNQQEKLNAILEEEKKIEAEQKFTTEKEQTTTIDSQRKGLQESRKDLEKKLEDVERKRWEVEKQIKAIEDKLIQIDSSSEQLVTEKNKLRDEILGVDKSLREIYFVVMSREEDKRKGQAEEQIARRATLEKIRAQENEKVQKAQWMGVATIKQKQIKNQAAAGKASRPMVEKMAKSFQAEEDQRKKFLQDVAKMSEEKDKAPMEQSQANVVATEVPVPPVPHKN